ncbi:MAG: FeS-binding protein, partial [Proteobacteria bacterium]|nr:FeS-binding protein [Pseudomonadota bacterium]
MNPEDKIRAVVDACADCDICRSLMDSTCFLFPELYRLYDKEMETGKKITPEELKNLVDLCNFCAVCPCPNIRADIMLAKTALIDRNGLGLSIRLLEDVERVGKLCGAFPQMTNFLLQSRRISGLLKGMTGIHRQRKFPRFPEDDFSTWMKRNFLHKKLQKKKKKVAYFAGCKARYFFPEVPRAAVEIFQHNEIEVYFPEQKCCGMPTLLEGDRQFTLKLVGFNVDHLADVVKDGYDIVCSCPTCGFMLKDIIKEGAYYSDKYQNYVGADEHYMKIPGDTKTANPGSNTFMMLKKSLYKGLLKDEGYFSSIDPQKRIMVAENTYDLGEYLRDLHVAGELETTFGPVPIRSAYYPPCHLREQNIGRPYQELLNLIPKMTTEPIQGEFYCCGMAGIMGFKRGFYATSIKMGSRLIEKIKDIDPQWLVTDCLSCRLQFRQMTPYKVLHPIEILKK